MKTSKIKAMILMIFVAISIACDSLANLSYVYADDNIIFENDYVEQATEKVKNIYISMVEMVKDNFEFYQVDIDSIENITLGEPYFVYDVIDSEQSGIIYYPVIQDEEIILIISVFFNGEVWNFGISEGISETLNMVDADENSFIVYENDNSVVVETDEKQIVVNEKKNSKNDKSKGKNEKFEKCTFKEKKEIIDNVKIEKKTKKDFEKNHEETEVDEAYTPLNTKSVTDYSRTCTLLTNGYTVSQGNYGLCWAASVATIYRYRTGNTSLTAMQVADLMEIDYNKGATPQKACETLKKYGIYYTYKNSTLSWENVMKNIDAKYPVYMSSKTSSSSGHATTIVGYSEYRGNRFMTMWNSGTAEYQGVIYVGNGTEYTYANDIYVWKYTLSYK